MRDGSERDDQRYAQLYPFERRAVELVSNDAISNVEGEAALLGALMIDNRLVADIRERVSQQDFLEPIHGRIFRAITALHDAGKQANPVTMKPLFNSDAALKSLGGISYLAGLTGTSAALIGARDFAEQIRALSRIRKLRDVFLGGMETLMDPAMPYIDTLAPMEDALWDVLDSQNKIRVLSAEKMMGLAKEGVTEARAGVRRGGTTKTLPELNDLIGNAEPGRVTLLGGRPSMGKTTTAISAAWGYAANGHPSLYCHAEMDSESIARKVACDLALAAGHKIPFKDLVDGNLNASQLRALDDAEAMAATLPMFFADVGRCDVSRIEAELVKRKRLLERQGRKLEIVFVDHIGLLTFGGEKDSFQRVSKISKALVDMAKKHQVHIFALAQLSRGLEQRDDKRPRLSDLRDSGDLEQDADNVVFVFRNEFYLSASRPKNPSPDWSIEWAEWEGKIELIGAKVRFSKPGSRRCRWYGEFSAVRSIRNNIDDGDSDMPDLWGER